MSEIYTELLAWSRDKIPAWRQDVLRRICLGEPLDDAAKSEVLAMLRYHHGVKDAPPPATPPHPFSADHFPGEALGGRRVSLAAIHGLKHVGQMPDGERLTFATMGLTIVYGNTEQGNPVMHACLNRHAVPARLARSMRTRMPRGLQH